MYKERNNPFITFEFFLYNVVRKYFQIIQSLFKCTYLKSKNVENMQSLQINLHSLIHQFFHFCSFNHIYI